MSLAGLGEYKIHSIWGTAKGLLDLENSVRSGEVYQKVLLES